MFSVVVIDDVPGLMNMEDLVSDFHTEEELDHFLASYITEANEESGQVKPVPLRRKSHRDYVLGFRTVTEDLMGMFATANGDTNPLWKDPGYAEKTAWGGLVAPPLYIYTASSVVPVPKPPDIEGFNLFAAGNHVEFHVPIRPGDEFTAEDVWIGVENRSRQGKPHRTLLYTGERRFFNQRGQRIVTLTGHIIGIVPLPGQDAHQGPPMDGRELTHYTDDELAEVYEHYDKELAGELRRGVEPRYWEDVAPEDDIGVVLKGPLDTLDNAAFLGAIAGGLGFATKWEMIRGERVHSPRDPVTGAYHFQMDWHLVDSSAQHFGMPRAIGFGVFMEMHLTHLITNWLGDQGWVQEIETKIGSPMFAGDIVRITGSVNRVYEENGIGKAEIAIRAVEQNGITMMQATAVVQLPHRGSPDEVVARLVGEEK